jgi:Spx/MgsR family transcriptional regulator
MIHVYGIPNCGSVKKALQWLTAQQVPHQFHDFKKEGVTKAQLENWLKQTSLALLVNKKGTTWRTLSAEEQAQADNKKGAMALMMEKPSVIKRPVLVKDDQVIAVGYDEELYAEKLKG